MKNFASLRTFTPTFPSESNSPETLWGHIQDGPRKIREEDLALFAGRQSGKLTALGLIELLPTTAHPIELISLLADPDWLDDATKPLGNSGGERMQVGIARVTANQHRENTTQFRRPNSDLG